MSSPAHTFVGITLTAKLFARHFIHLRFTTLHSDKLGGLSSLRHRRAIDPGGTGTRTPPLQPTIL